MNTTNDLIKMNLLNSFKKIKNNNKIIYSLLSSFNNNEQIIENKLPDNPIILLITENIKIINNLILKNYLDLKIINNEVCLNIFLFSDNIGLKTNTITINIINFFYIKMNKNELISKSIDEIYPYPYNNLKILQKMLDLDNIITYTITLLNGI